VADDLVLPLFVVEGSSVREPIVSMPGVFRHSVDQVVDECKRVRDVGVPGVILFGIPAEKDPRGSGADAVDGIVQRAIAALKRDVPDLCVMTDVCMCEYTDHGHCGIVAEGEVRNDESLLRLAATALSHARAGADVVAPSDMMDGRVAAMRNALEQDGHVNTLILAYAAKFASAFYGPFRDAVGSAATLGGGDKSTYPVAPTNSDEAVRVVGLDIDEGADFVMVKPALPYLDIVRRVKETYRVPVFAYQVGGEYAMLKAAAANGWLDERSTVLESLLGMKRAGASAILTYYAIDVARWLAE